MLFKVYCLNFVYFCILIIIQHIDAAKTVATSTIEDMTLN